MSEENPLETEFSKLFQPDWVAKLGQGTTDKTEYKFKDRPEHTDRPRRGRTDFGNDGRRPDARRPRRDEPRERRLPPALPEGITADVRPDSAAVEAMCTHMRATKRAYSIFDAAKLILGDAARFRVKYVAAAGKGLHLLRPEGAVFLSGSDAMDRFLSRGDASKHYEEKTVQVEGPKGNFSSIAVCGLSGHVFGPPNHHSYLPSLVKYQQRHYPSLSLEDYKRKIRIVSDPVAVEEWKEKQTQATHWIWRPSPVATPETTEEIAPAAQESVAVNTTTTDPVEEAAAERPPVEEAELTPTVDEGIFAEEGAAEEPTVDETAAEAPTAAETTTTEGGEVVLTSREAWEEHVRKNYAHEAVKVRRDATVQGNVPKDNLSPELFNLLRSAVDEIRHRPQMMAQKMCRAFENRGFKLFKRRGGKLFVSAVRPRALAEDTVLSDRVGMVVTALKNKQEQTLAELLESLHAAESGGNRAWLEDIHWLADQGYVIIYSDDAVTLGFRATTPASGSAAKDVAPADAAPENPSEPVSEVEPPSKADGTVKAVEPVEEAAPPNPSKAPPPAPESMAGNPSEAG